MPQRKSQPSTFLCRNCGENFAKWFGKCPNCGEWNTLAIYRPPSEAPGAGRARRSGTRPERGLGIPGRPRGDAGTAAPWSGGERDSAFDAGVQLLGEISVAGPKRIESGVAEFDRVLGGGIVPGSVVLIGGDPGIGKSTLLLQVAARLVERGAGVLYVSGEESAAQTKLRAQRLNVSGRLAVLAEGDLERVLEAVGEGVPGGGRASADRTAGDASAGDESPGSSDASRERRPVDVLFIDSIQSAYLPSLPSAPGSVLQVREGALVLTQMAKRHNVAVLLIGHVTKEGGLAGPRTLEHIVDAVLMMDGEQFQAYRMLRSVKNRFGSVHEIGVFDMRDDGLHEVSNPSQLFLGDGAGRATGSAVVAGIEGTRSLLVEIQALVHPTRYGIPQRIATGFDGRRLAILLAVLVKRGGIDVTGSDVFVNVVGGLRLDEPGVDLGVLLAIASSTLERPAGGELAAFGEIGLGGEVRRVSDPERRIAEAARLGFTRVLIPAATKRDLDARKWRAPAECELLPVATLREALGIALATEPDQ
jgi:DNA repair protein RadA/Sms